MTEPRLRNRRRHPRIRVQPMYTSVSVQRIEQRDAGFGMCRLEGHAYDVSLTGVRIELDVSLAVGEQVTVSLGLPGATRDINAKGDVVWVNDEDDDPGPRRAALVFTGFVTKEDRARLAGYLATNELRQAA